MAIRRPRTSDPRELEKWQNEVSEKINLLFTEGLDTTGDVIIDLATKGLVLKDTQATPHYWRITISIAGVLVITDLGTVKP